MKKFRKTEYFFASMNIYEIEFVLKNIERCWKGECMVREKISILLIEDDQNAANEIKEYLIKQNRVAKVDCAGGVQEAKEYCAQEMYDVALLDLIMPEEDGFQFLQHCMRVSAAPVNIVVSAVSSEDVIRKSFAMGAKYYMMKPLQKEILYQRIWDVLRLCGGEEQPAQTESFPKENSRRITELFLRMGVPPHLKGYQYLKEAVKFTLEDRMIIYHITKDLYPKVAKKFGVTSTKVELAIRHTAEVMYNRDGMRRFYEVLGFPTERKQQKPTNGEMVALIADKLISSEEE